MGCARPNGRTYANASQLSASKVASGLRALDVCGYVVGKRATAGAGHGAARAGPGLGASVRVSMETHPRRRWTPASWHRSLATRGGTVRARRVHIHSPALARTCSSTATINSEDPLPRDSPDTSLSPQKFTR